MAPEHFLSEAQIEQIISTLLDGEAGVVEFTFTGLDGCTRIMHIETRLMDNIDKITEQVMERVNKREHLFYTGSNDRSALDKHLLGE